MKANPPATREAAAEWLETSALKAWDRNPRNGDPKAATEAIGDVEVGDVPEGDGDA